MAGPKTLTTRELNRALLARQGLLTRKRVSIPRMVAQTGGLQTQEPRDAFVSLAARIDGFDPEKFRRATERREIVRGSFYRCTLHTVTREDFLSFRLALSEVIARDSANWRDAYATFDKGKVIAAIEQLLADGEPRSPKVIGDALAAQFPKASREGLMNCARCQVPVAMTPTDDRWGYSRPATLALPELFLGAELAPDTPEAKTEILRRGIAAIGPATIADLRTWSRLTGVKELLEPLIPRLREFRDEAGRTLYDLPRAPRPRPDTPAPVRFLGEFDNVFLSHDDRERIIDAGHSDRFKISTNGRRRYTFMVDGFVAGTWKPKPSRQTVTIEIEPFVKLTRSDRAAVEAEARTVARILGPGAEFKFATSAAS
ncbi:MAG: winged helix DNA-binding domain-containing protein [Solirubrobacterales bacterium]